MSVENFKVSIVIPVHNAGKTLNRCMNSIFSQSYKNFECLLIENCSVDNSKAICESYAKKFNNVLYTSIESASASKARNVGLSMATGDIVGFCDSDDFLEENAIKSVVEEFKKESNIVAVFGGFNIGIVEKDTIRKQYRGLKSKRISAVRALQLNLVNDSVMGSVWNKYYKKQILKNIKFDEQLSLCEDMHFNAMVLDSVNPNYDVKIINAPLYCYMDNPNSITHNANVLFDQNDELKYIVALNKIMEDCHLDNKSISYLKMKESCFAIDYIMNSDISNTQRKKLKCHLRENYVY